MLNAFLFSTNNPLKFSSFYILDKDKKIIAKHVSISQLEDIIDRLQGFSDAPKLFPPDPEEDEQMQKKE
mgnify:CR=1 FL=1